ncbi:monocarboxylate transporter 13 [Drosophila grimshawi]|uniref:GH22059 n=1 Tax=Drosophila grimshawi TaxID=7222 RepID=B4J9W8_DROGR|nr:monocarboxylate transporter 13 [Drosophila grimshawi]XP_032590449.1 monocarboxylate transporter 13 [Drosophila grimshawi]XP_032590450.1 monocarboxylate transporter 13 [Drosophila grimshawi]EDW02555.1 GH22059 [Drosophila grimshawi]
MDVVQVSRIVPDGGWGWVIVAAVAVINMTNQSILSVFGLLFGGELRMHENTFTAALITNLNSLALNFSGLFIGPAIKSFKPRNVAATGCLLVFFGLTVCSFATEIWHFIVGYSFFVGFGLGLISPSTFMAINSYFSSKRGCAVGVSLAGTGVGQVIIPHVVRYFLQNYGFRSAVLAMAALSLTGLFGAMFLKPLNPPVTHNNRKHMRLLMDKEDKNQNSALQAIVVQPAQKKDPMPQTVLEPSKDASLCSRMGHRLAQALDLELLKDIVFWSIIVGMALVYTSTINFTMVFPHFLEHTAGLDSSVVAFCMSVVAGADIVFRLLLPCITDRLRIPYRVVFLMGTAGMLTSRLFLAETTSLPIIIAMSVLTGMTKSATVINNNLTISAHCRSEKLAGGLGLSMIAKGVIVILVGQMLGWIRDYSNSYVICLYAQNVVLLLVVLVWTPEIYYRFRRQSRNTSKSIETTYTMPTEQATETLHSRS